MPYRKPGAYARFVPTAAVINSPGQTRVMALVGTGTMFYDIVNEVVTRSAISSSDALANSNVFEIKYLTSAPLKNGQPQSGTLYQEGVHYTLQNGRYIAWNTGSNTATASVDPTQGSSLFAAHVNVQVDPATSYLIQKNSYKIEITYIDGFVTDDPNLGTYRVTDLSTDEILGEFSVSSTAVNGVIPGVQLRVDNTFVPLSTPVQNPDGSYQSATAVGDYVIVNTVPANIDSTSFNLNPATPSTNPPFPTPGMAIYATYTYKKDESHLVPKIFYNYDDIVAEYGNYDVTASGRVINSLALGAEIAFLNGVNPIVCVQAKSDSPFEINNAIDKLQLPIPGIENFNVIVPLSVDPLVGAHAQNHVDLMSSPDEGKERMVYLGAPTGKQPSDYAQDAINFNDERVVYVVPANVTKDIQDVNTGVVNTRVLPACYPAVAVAAVALRNDPAEPLTNKTITGFNTLVQLYSESQMNLMAGAGCLVLTMRGSNIVIRHGITTMSSDINQSEITLVQIKDYVIAAARQNLADIYVGKKLQMTVVNDIKVSLLSILDQFVGQNIIMSYSGVSVKRSNLDPRQVDIRFQIEAVYPLNYINIEFSFSQVG